MCLRLDWCSYQAARYAVEKWHYLGVMPGHPLVTIGVWEHGLFIGAIVFGKSVNRNLGSPYNLSMTQVAELSRVALTTHVTPVSKMLAIALRMIKKQSPKLRLIVSFADQNAGHYGGIYQASNWLYLGVTADSYKYQDRNGRIWHQRQVAASGWKLQFGCMRAVPRMSECVKLPQRGKHRYAYPFDDDMRAMLLPLAKPYPKRATSIDSDAPACHAGEGGAIPTVALQECL